MKTYIIYRHTLNNKDYVGYTSLTLEERLEKHIKNSLVDKSERHFHRAIRKYGVDNLLSEVIDSATTKEEAKQKERHYIMELDTFKNGYNMTLGGDGDNTKEKYTEEEMAEWKKDMSVRMTGMGNSNARPDVTTEAMTEVLVQFVIDNNVHGRNILQREILNELKRSLDISIEAVRRRTKNIGNLVSLVNEKLIALGLEEVKYDPYHRSEKQRKTLANKASGYSWVTDGTTSKQVKKSEIDKYLAENTAYRRGRII